MVHSNQEAIRRKGRLQVKTFKLKKLEIVKHKEDIENTAIPLLDGLIINREDEENQWMIEAYVTKDFKGIFDEFYKNQQEIMVQATITKETNEPATFITTIINMNEIEDNMNVLFLGTMLDRKKAIIMDRLTELIKKGYQGNQLIKMLKKDN